MRVTDQPIGAGRSFLIERGLTSKAEREALVSDYVAQSEQRDGPAVLVLIDGLAVLPAEAHDA